MRNQLLAFIALLFAGACAVGDGQPPDPGNDTEGDTVADTGTLDDSGGAGRSLAEAAPAPVPEPQAPLAAASTCNGAWWRAMSEGYRHVCFGLLGGCYSAQAFVWGLTDNRGNYCGRVYGESCISRDSRSRDQHLTNEIDWGQDGYPGSLKRIYFDNAQPNKWYCISGPSYGVAHGHAAIVDSGAITPGYVMASTGTSHRF